MRRRSGRFRFRASGHQSGLQCEEPGLHPRKPLHLARRKTAGPDRGADRRRPQPGGRGRRIYRCGARRYGLSAVALGAGAGGLLRNHAGLFLEPADPPAAAGAQGPDFPAVPHLAPPELPGAPRSGLLRRAAVSDAALLLDGRAREDGPLRPAVDYGHGRRRGEEDAFRSHSERQGDRRCARISEPVLFRALFQAVHGHFPDGVPLGRTETGIGGGLRVASGAAGRRVMPSGRVRRLPGSGGCYGGCGRRRRSPCARPDR